MGCRLKNDFQNSLKLNQFVKNFFYKDINIMLDFSKLSVCKDTVKLFFNSVMKYIYFALFSVVLIAFLNTRDI